MAEPEKYIDKIYVVPITVQNVGDIVDWLASSVEFSSDNNVVSVELSETAAVVDWTVVDFAVDDEVEEDDDDAAAKADDNNAKGPEDPENGTGIFTENIINL